MECRVQYKCDGVQNARIATADKNAVKQGRDHSRFQAYSSQVYFATIFQHSHNGLSHAYITVLRGPQRKPRSHLNKIGSLNNKMDGIVCFLRPAGVGPTIFSTITKPIKVCNTSN